MRKIVGIGICLIGIAVPAGIYAIEEDKRIETVIAFDLTAEDRYTYEVKVNEGGYLYDGSQRITNGIVAYELSVGESKEFKVEAKSGYEVKEIRINNEEQNTDIEKIRIWGVSAPSYLEVRYEKSKDEIIPDIPTPPDNTNPSDDIQGEIIDKVNDAKHNEVEADSLVPITGDMLKISEYVCLMLIVLYRLYVSKRGIDMQSHVDNIEISKDIEESKKL